MSLSLAWRAVLLQALAVGALFAVLLALPLPIEVFREQGALIGPLSWLGCSLITAGLLRLSPARGLLAAGGSGLLAVAVSVPAGHLGSMVIGVLAFGAICSLRVPLSGDRDDGDRTRDLRLESSHRKLG